MSFQISAILQSHHARKLVALLALHLMLSGPTLAESPQPDFEERLQLLEQELERLQASEQPPLPMVDVESAKQVDPTTTGPITNVEFSCPPTAKTTAATSKYPTVKVGGFFQADWGFFSQDPVNIATVGDIQDGADFRRARLNAQGDVWENVGYQIEFDFGFPGRPSFMDVYLDIRETPLGTFRFGQWRQPLGMDGLTSVKDLTFLERALPFAFLPFRQIGFGVFDHSRDETITWAASVYRFPTDAFGGNVGDNGGVGMATRGTFAPWITRDGRQLIHLGGGYSGGDPANDVVRYRNQPEFFISETGGADLVPIGVPTNVPPFVDTGAIPTHTFHLFSVEGGLVLNSLYMQSEVLYAVIDRIDQPTTSFSGAYAQAGYFLTGEIRPYNRTNGVFGRVKPLDNFGHGGCGAWELAARWSYLDLNDEDIAGGRLNDVTVGVNWYLNSNTKFQFNWIQAFLDNPAFGDSNADIFAFRGQVDF